MKVVKFDFVFILPLAWESRPESVVGTLSYCSAESFVGHLVFRSQHLERR